MSYSLRIGLNKNFSTCEGFQSHQKFIFFAHLSEGIISWSCSLVGRKQLDWKVFAVGWARAESLLLLLVRNAGVHSRGLEECRSWAPLSWRSLIILRFAESLIRRSGGRHFNAGDWWLSSALRWRRTLWRQGCPVIRGQLKQPATGGGCALSRSTMKPTPPSISFQPLLTKDVPCRVLVLDQIRRQRHCQWGILRSSFHTWKYVLFAKICTNISQW